MPKDNDLIQLNETLTALVSEHGFKRVAEQLREYALDSTNEIGLPEELLTCWEKTAEMLENIIEAWEKAETETKP